MARGRRGKDDRNQNTLTPLAYPLSVTLFLISVVGKGFAYIGKRSGAGVEPVPTTAKCRVFFTRRWKMRERGRGVSERGEYCICILYINAEL